LKKKYVLVMVLLATLFITTIVIAKAATTLAPPTVGNLPTNWQKTDSTAYPDAPSEYDPAGAGMLEYTDQTTYDIVRIYYEKAKVTSYTSTQLTSEAEDLFNRVDSSDTRPLESSGTTVYAGVTAGYAKGYDADENTYKMELVFIKSNYFLNVHAYYDDVSASRNNVDSIINSISVSGAAGGGASPSGAAAGGSFIGSTMFFVIIGVVAAVIVVVVVLAVAMRRKKSAQPQQPTQYGYPPPPPPMQ
jgi:hypothetical protein